MNVHVVTGSSSSMQNMVACVNRAGVEVVETVLEQLAASEAVLTPDEKELGVALVDIGGGTTAFSVFERGSLWHTGVVAVGGDHFTNDIAVGLRMPIPDAEKLKRRSGCALTALVPETDTMEVASMAGRRARTMPRRVLSEILQPRAEEICHLLWDEIRRAGYEKSLNSGIVLTGGGAMLEGMTEIAEQIFDLPVRRASPEGVGGLADHVSNPAFGDLGGPGRLCPPQQADRSPSRGRRDRAHYRSAADPFQGILWARRRPHGCSPANDRSRNGFVWSSRRRRFAPAPASRSSASAVAAATP